MSKTFFDYQQEARSRSRKAVFAFALTVFFTVLSVAVITVIALGVAEGLSSDQEFTTTQTVEQTADYFAPVMAACSLAFFIIACGSLLRSAQMRQGPESVMKAMRGIQIDSSTDDPKSRQLLNIVEEMSIASGIPVPLVYLVEEPGINAFAVGLRPERAAVGVTRGALNAFNRDELQGVIAHEFSHILWGDMRLNTRLISWLAGLFLISEAGVMLLRIGGSSSRGRSRGGKGDGGAALAVLGIGVWICGSIGLLFGKLLQARISRDREYLADASAVQFTRNPQGIGNALRKLGKSGTRARLTAPESMECAHMMFGSVKSMSFTGLMATHPPLEKRIRQVLPDWDGSFLQPEAPQEVPAPNTQKSERKSADRSARTLLGLGALAGSISSQALSQTRSWIQTLPAPFLERLHQPDGARALLYLLLRSPDPAAVEKQQRFLKETESSGVLECMRELSERILAQSAAARLSLLELCLPVLRSQPQLHQQILKIVEELIAADGQVSLTEYAVRQMTRAALEPEAESRARTRRRIPIQDLEREVNIFLSLLSRIGSETEEEAERGFEAARNQFLGYQGGITLRLLPSDACGLSALHSAFDRLACLAPAFQQRLLAAGEAAIRADGEILDSEVQLFRAAAAALHIPVPPGLLSA